MIKLSIITINYNNRIGLEETIISVISQINQSFEYIIIDGNSNDGSKDVISKYKDKITYAISEPDSGIYNAMNKGVSKANGEYCLFLNSGDKLANNNVVNEILNFNPSKDIIVGDTILSDTSKVWKAPETISMLTFMKGSLSHQSTLIKRILLLEYPYDEDLRIISDWKFCIDTLINHNKSYQKYNKVISIYDKTGISSNPQYFEKANTERIAVLHELIPERILIDYEKLVSGETDFEKLMIRISRNKKISTFLYKILYPIVNVYDKLSRKSVNL